VGRFYAREESGLLAEIDTFTDIATPAATIRGGSALSV
jgi:hypothetical protein